MCALLVGRAADAVDRHFANHVRHDEPNGVDQDEQREAACAALEQLRR